MEYIKLTEEEKRDLKALHKVINDQKQCDRIKAILLLDKGYTGREVSEILLLDEDTITNWKQRFVIKTSLKDWFRDNYIGYSGKINEAEKNVIIKYLEDNIITDSKEVKRLVSAKFGIEYSKSGIINVIHELGFTYKQIKLIPGKYDEEEQKKFKEEYENLEKTLKEKEVILFTDGVHPQHNTVNTKAWIKTGEEKIIKSNTGRRRININGIYNPHSQEIVYHESDTINAQSTIELFKKVENYYSAKDKIYVISDNAKYYKNKDVTKFLEGSRIKLIFLPPYSPNLNLIERLWKLLRKEVINTKYYEHFEDFKRAVLGFLENADQSVDQLKNFIGQKLHLLNSISA
jgi:transposase